MRIVLSVTGCGTLTRGCCSPPQLLTECGSSRLASLQQAGRRLADETRKNGTFNMLQLAFDLSQLLLKAVMRSVLCRAEAMQLYSVWRRTTLGVASPLCRSTPRR